MRNSCFNIGKDIFHEKSIFKKIDFLIKSNVCFVKDENYNLFLEELSFLDDNYSHNELEEKIANLTYLEFNQFVIDEVSKTVSQLLDDNKNEQSFYGILLREKFKSKLLLSHNPESKEKLVKKHLKKALKTIKNSFDFNLHSIGMVNENLSVNLLPLIAESLFNNYHIPSNDNENNCNINYMIKKDALRHIFPLGEPQLNMYESGENFLLIMDMLNFIDELKQELKKIEHYIVVKKEASGSNYNIQNLIDEINRFPLVFKDAYSCELFLYTLSHIKTTNSMVFSYFYEIFKEEKHFDKKVFKDRSYFQFIKSVYGKNEIRIRKNLSEKRYDTYLDHYKKCKNYLDKQKANETNL